MNMPTSSGTPEVQNEEVVPEETATVDPSPGTAESHDPVAENGVRDDAARTTETADTPTTPETSKSGGVWGTIRSTVGNTARGIRKIFWTTGEEKSNMPRGEKSVLMSRRKFLGKTTAAAGALATAYYLGTRGNGSTSLEAPETTAKKPSGGFAFRESELGHESTTEEIMHGMPEIYKGNEGIWKGFDQGTRDRLREGNQQLVSDGVVDKQGHVIETKKPEKGAKKPNDVQSALSSLNSLWRVAPVPAAEALGWAVNQYLRGENYKKLMQLTRGIAAGEGKDAIAAGTRYDAIDTRSQSLAQLRKLRDDITKTKGQVTLLMHETESVVSLVQRSAQATWLAGEIAIEIGLTLTGILSSTATYHNGIGIAAAILINKLRSKTSEPKNEAMLKKFLADLEFHLSAANDAISDLLKTQPATPPQVPPPPAVNPAPPPPTPQPPSNPNPAGGQTPTP